MAKFDYNYSAGNRINSLKTLVMISNSATARWH
jgi:hypothetical protein